MEDRRIIGYRKCGNEIRSALATAVIAGAIFLAGYIPDSCFGEENAYRKYILSRVAGVMAVTSLMSFAFERRDRQKLEKSLRDDGIDIRRAVKEYEEKEREKSERRERYFV